MKLIQKAILPAVVALAGLASVDAMAAGTGAGSTISNEATMTYTAGGANNEVSDTADVLVDVKIDFNFTDPTGLLATTATTIDGIDYYVSAGFSLSNTSNTDADFVLSAAVVDTSSTFDVAGTARTPDAVATGGMMYIVDGGTIGTFTDDSPRALTSDNLIELQEDATSGTIHIIVPTENVPAKDGDVIGFSVQASAYQVDYGTGNVLVTDDSENLNDNNAVQFVFANDGTSTVATDYDNIEITYAGSTLGGLPDFGDGGTPNDESDDGFVKAATVVWDPFADISAGDEPKAIPGAVIRYTLTLNNNGTGAAGLTEISDDITDMAVSVCTETTVLQGVNNYTCPAVGITYLNASNADVTSSITTSAAWSGDELEASYSEFAAGFSGVVTFYVIVD